MDSFTDPCIRACTPTWDGNRCEGCGRTDQDKKIWLDITEKERKDIVQKIEDEGYLD